MLGFIIDENIPSRGHRKAIYSEFFLKGAVNYRSDHLAYYGGKLSVYNFALETWALGEPDLESEFESELKDKLLQVIFFSLMPLHGGCWWWNNSIVAYPEYCLEYDITFNDGTTKLLLECKSIAALFDGLPSLYKP
jgi:hypothetical protein